MPTATETARREARHWSDLAKRWTLAATPEVWDVRPPTEKDVVVFFDPRNDLTKRAEQWNHDMTQLDLSGLALFAAGLAEAEAEGWSSGTGDLATKAYEDRRFLFSDRILHWAVPWLDSVANCFPDVRVDAEADRDFMLALAEEMRPAPELESREGLTFEGHDSFGPIEPFTDMKTWSSSVWSGDVVVERAGSPLDETSAPRLIDVYRRAADRWGSLAARYPGSAQLWRDLSERAAKTARSLESLMAGRPD